VNQFPTVSVGPNHSITLPNNSTTLSGTGTDPDGTLTTYAWVKVSGPDAGTIQTPGNASTAVSGLTEGIYVFRLTVTDNAGAIASSNMQVTVQAAPVPNVIPVANAGRDIELVLPDNSTTLDGRSSADTDGNIISWKWSKVQGPNEYTLANVTSSTAPLSGLRKGVYIFELTITDNRGGISTDRVTVNVIKINMAPLAHLADTITVSSGAQNTLLSASQSYDPDGVITSYSWNYKKGPKEPKMFSPDSANTIIANLVPGFYEFGLTLTDDDGAKTSKDIVVKVLNSGRRMFIPEVSLYPNPAVSNVNVRIDSEARGRTTLTIYDISSRPVYTEVFSKETDAFIKTINVSRFTRGTYTVVIQVEQSEKVAKLLIKQ
jgi:hypothetical protein